MKILQLTYSLSSGGGERFVVDLSNELSKENEVILVQILSNENKLNAHYLPDVSERIKYVNLESNKGLSLGVLWKVYRTIVKYKPDIVHAHCSLLTIALAALLYRRPGYFHTLHSLAHRCLDKKWLKPIFEILYKYKVQPITISKTCLESYEDLYHLGNGTLITNGRSPVQTTSDEMSVKTEIDSYKLHPDDKVFLHVARVHPVKNQQLLFDTFDRLVSEGEHVLLVVIGNGYFESPFAKYSNCKGIHILGEKRNVGDYLAASDYFIMSSKMEGLPISLLEAMSMGKIPVSTPAGGVCDVIRNGENGYLSSSHSPEDYYHTLKDAIGNVGNVTCEDIQNEYKAEYSMVACAKKYLNLFGGGKCKLILTKQERRMYIREDAKANCMDCNYLRYLLSLIYGLEFAHSFRYLKSLRNYEYHLNNSGFLHRFMGLYYKVKTSRLGMKYNLHITPNTCGYGLKIYHIFGGGQIINVDKVGNYCSFNAGVVLGKKDSSKKPKLGDYVSIAPGAKVFGDITIGNNVFIAANAIVTKSVPDNSVVVGVNKILNK